MYGGNNLLDDTVVERKHTLDKVKTKNQHAILNYKFHTFDRIIEKDAERSNLVDDILLPEGAWDRKQGMGEQNPIQQQKPTPVTLANVWGSKKDRKIKFDNLRILLYSGCSDSIAQMKYGKKNKKEIKSRKFATGSGQLKTKYQARYYVYPT